MMAARPKSTPRSWRSSDEAGQDQRPFPGNNMQQSRYAPSSANRKNESLVDAAEDLAAARVNAMMQALSNNHGSEGEI